MSKAKKKVKKRKEFLINKKLRIDLHDYGEVLIVLGETSKSRNLMLSINLIMTTN